jgi:hypothetical protein
VAVNDTEVVAWPDGAVPPRVIPVCRFILIGVGEVRPTLIRYGGWSEQRHDAESQNDYVAKPWHAAIMGEDPDYPRHRVFGPVFKASVTPAA